jgi:hypothetical protein
LPFGRTFAGRFESATDEAGVKSARTIVGAYMLRGQRPNGANGPTTDDLYAGIAGGTIFDVSLGLYGGETLCDVCGHGLNDYDPESRRYLCQHVPGTHLRMTEGEIVEQQARGVVDGVASYTLQDAHAAEVSAVFDGAVPGAGFRKAIAFAKSGRLSGVHLGRARIAYRPFLSPGDRPGRTRPLAGRQEKTMAMSLPDFLRRFKVTSTDGDDLELEDLEHNPVSPPHAAQFTAELKVPDPELVRLQAELAAERKARADDQAARNAEKVAGIEKEATDFAKAQSQVGKILPAAETHLATIRRFASLHKSGLSTEGIDLSTAVDGLVGGLNPHVLTGSVSGTGKLPDGVKLLDTSGDDLSADTPEAREQAGRDSYENGRKPAVSNAR